METTQEPNVGSNAYYADWKEPSLFDRHQGLIICLILGAVLALGVWLGNGLGSPAPSVEQELSGSVATGTAVPAPTKEELIQQHRLAQASGDVQLSKLKQRYDELTAELAEVEDQAAQIRGKNRWHSQEIDKLVASGSTAEQPQDTQAF